MNRRASHINRLSEARIRLAHQIDQLLGRDTDQGVNRSAEIRELLTKVRDTLAEIEECITAVWREGQGENSRPVQ